MLICASANPGLGEGMNWFLEHQFQPQTKEDLSFYVLTPDESHNEQETCCSKPLSMNEMLK
jgi:hypothetical protein